ncbi:MAG TPA: efflux RND transporter periplasmic adaptor subunit [Caulobacteraceae bacterium]|nr:efflux RND transporter periplasmic adaptor subunit [Caulobacteraceae bacterium]
MDVAWTSAGRFAAASACGAVLAASLAACGAHAPKAADAQTVAAPTDDKVELTDSQLKSITIGTVGEHVFSPQRTAVGSIDFNEDRAVQVFSNYPGKIIAAHGEIGDEISKGQVLYTIESPDLMQAEQTLIAAAGVYDLTTRALSRDRQLHESKGIADKDLEQAVSDQMTAQGNLEAAKSAVRVFGKSDADVAHMISARQVEPDLVVRSPIAGRITARAAQPGLLVQPGSTPAPFAVADVSTVWMIANVAESDVPTFRPGNPVAVKVMAFPGHDFGGMISVVGATVDPNTHTEAVRTVVKDPQHELRPGMFATYVITTGKPAASLAMPLDGVVREGDGSMKAWVTVDGHHFTRRTVTLGISQDGFDQITGGLNPGERVVTGGAIYLSNMANAADGG